MEKLMKRIPRTIKEIAVNLAISEEAALSVWHLRTKSHWSQDLENKLLEELRAGNEVDMKDYGCPESTALVLLKRVEEILTEQTEKVRPPSSHELTIFT